MTPTTWLKMSAPAVGKGGAKGMTKTKGSSQQHHQQVKSLMSCFVNTAPESEKKPAEVMPATTSLTRKSIEKKFSFLSKRALYLDYVILSISVLVLLSNNIPA